MKRVTKLALAMSSLVVLATSVTGVANYVVIVGALEEQALGRLAGDIDLAALTLQSKIEPARSDLLALSGSSSFLGLVQSLSNPGASDTPVWIDRLNGTLRRQLQAKPNYLQFRFIGVADGGRELVRVDRNAPEGEVRVVAPSDLQRKGNMSYFGETLLLAPGQVRISPIDLNREFGEIEDPPHAVIRLSTPVADASGTPIGILIINIDVERIFTSMRQSLPRDHALYVVNDRDQYLLGPEPEDDFGFEYGRPRGLRDTFPTLEVTDDPYQAVIRDAAGARQAVATRPVLLGGTLPIRIAESVPFASLSKPGVDAARTSLVCGLVVVIAALNAAVLLARSFVRPLEQITRAVANYRGGPMPPLPTRAGGEIGTLAVAVSRMATDITDRTLTLTTESDNHRRTMARLEAMVRQTRIYRAALVSSLDAIVIVGTGNDIIDWNPVAGRMFGLDPAMRGRTLDSSLAVYRPEGPIAQAIAAVRAGQDVQTFETDRKLATGETRTLSVSVFPIRGDEGADEGVCIICRPMGD